MSGFDVPLLERSLTDSFAGVIGADRLGTAPPPANGPGFGAVLADAVAKVDGLSQNVTDQVQSLASGEPVALHDIMMSMGKSEVAFNLMLEVRNRLVDAWDKLSRSVM